MAQYSIQPVKPEDKLKNLQIKPPDAPTRPSNPPTVPVDPAFNFDRGTPAPTSPAPAATTAQPKGLIATTLARGATPKPASFEAERIALDPGTQTVEGRVQGLLARGNPLLEASRTRAAQESNRRGLLNSTMAVQAGEMAAINTALPIASQDANAALAVAGRNQDAINRAREFGAASKQQFGAETLRGQQESSLMAQRAEIDKQLQSADAATRERLLQQQGQIDSQLQELRGSQAMEQQGSQQAHQLTLAEIDRQLQTNLQQLRGEQAERLAQIDGAFKERFQASQSAAAFYAQVSTSIGEILNNPDIRPDMKDKLIQKQLDLLENGLTVIGDIANMDLAGLLDFSASEPLAPPPPPPRQRDKTALSAYEKRRRNNDLQRDQ